MNPKSVLNTRNYILLLFCLLFLSIPVLNHYFYRTSALDLGIFNHAIYNYAHFKTSYFSLGLTPQETGIIECLGNHFSPLIFLLAPFYFIFGTYTLLIVQVAFIIAGGIGSYRYSSLLTENEFTKQTVMIHFFCIWGIYSALAFDFHLNVIAAMLVPWLFVFNKKGNIKSLLLVSILILLTRENMSLWLAFIFTGLWIDKKLRFSGFTKLIYPAAIAISIIYFVTVTSYIMPGFVPYESSGQLARYSHLGNNLSEIVKTIILEPFQSVKMLFSNTKQGDIYQPIKTELHLMVLLAGGWLFLFRPSFLVMLVPIYFQKLLSNDPGMWGINYHYSIEFVPILSLLFIEVTSGINHKKWLYPVTLSILVLTASSTTYTFFHRKSIWYTEVKANPFSPTHYKSNLQIQTINHQLNTIPQNSAVSCHYSLAPHLAYREEIYHFPNIKNAEYIVLLKNTTSFYPLQKDEYLEKIEAYRNSEIFSIWSESNDLIIFSKSKK
ncbi:DUF2079 domain-containing protein [Mangrovibacterium marinum]|uniref:Putative membrane protein n=1 Tax=Mangrovibacterium marinum TaxID=1639118 RepID=A0A2T5C5Y3_9BACT|nr:DUF2079 domain-containing protein [Mangrovibacterium marinum]PTN10291.1 putative membrane protein [Mangrovibacterium marinum]